MLSKDGNETVVRVAIAIGSFLLAQVWAVGKSLYRERKLKRAMRSEIEELSPWLRRNLINLECMIQLACLHELANHGPVMIPVQIHAEHFPEITLKLSKPERRSIESIYGLIYRINDTSEKIIDVNPQCVDDQAKMYELVQLLDNAYRNSHHALLLIRLHLENSRNSKKLEKITHSNETDPLFPQLGKTADEQLLRLAAEAKSLGAAGIRAKYHDGAVSAADVAATPELVPGRVYFDATGAKFKCLEIRDDAVVLAQLESKIGSMIFDAIVQRPIAEMRHCYEIADKDELDRLERRLVQLSNKEKHRLESPTAK